MATINNKLIHFKSKSDFNSRYAETTDGGLTYGDFLGTSIVFIQDAKQIWTHGQFYDANEATLASLGITATAAELNYMDGVTSNVQTQLNEIKESVDSISDPYEINLTNLLSAEDSESISTAIGGIDNLNATVQDNRIIVGTISNGSVSVSIRILGNVTTLYYLLDSVVGLTLNEVKITNTSGTLSKSVTTHSVLTENMVINSLTSDETTLPLSAAQGKALDNKISSIDVSADITNAINALDSSGQTASTGEVISSVSQENGIILVSKKTFSADDIPELPQSKITDLETALAGKQDAGDYATNSALTEGLAGKQDTLVFGTPYNASTNKAATMQDVTSAVADKVEQSDITSAIQALDSEGQTCSNGEVISSVTQADGVISVQKKTLAENDIPTLSIAKISDLQTSLDAKQDNLTAGTGLEITEGNVINVTLDTTVFFVAETAPASPSEDQKKKICLVPADTSEEGNFYTEYVWVIDDTHPDGYWEEFGTYKSEVDLTDYLKTSDAESTYLKITDAESEYATKTELAGKQDVGDYATQTSLTSHTGNTSNPHNVTKAQVGLGNVDNTSDADKPISNATQTALNGKQATLVSGTNIKTVNGESLLGSGDISTYTPSSIDVSTLFADTASIASGISSQIAALGNSGVTEFPVLYGGSTIGNIKPTWIRTTSGVTNMMCIADNKIWYFEIQGTTVQRASLAIS